MRRFSMLFVCLASVQTLALADDAAPTTDATVAVATPAPAPAPPTTATAAAPAPAPVAEDGIRFRNGFSLSAGHEFGSGPSEDFSAQLYGVDWRIGAVITPAVSMYLQTHLSFGEGEIGGAGGATGNFAAALMGEYMIPQRVFFAGGGGYGVLNNPSGPMGQLRVGWYPMKGGDDTHRRINVALDSRFYFPGDQIGRVTQISLTVGYDRF